MSVLVENRGPRRSLVRSGRATIPRHSRMSDRYRMQRRTVILHGHIFKNAGTTFDWSLKRNFGEGFVDHRDDCEMRQQGAAYLLQYLMDRPGVVALSSHHLCCPLPHSSDIDFVPVFLLRHPIERIWSVYHFERQQQSSSPGARQAKKLDLKNYTLWRMQDDVYPTIRNYQVRYCTATGGGEHVQESAADLLEAEAYLRDRAMLGIVERYDESMVLMERQFAQRGLDVKLEYLAQNVTAAGRAHSRGEKIDAVRDALGADYALVQEKNALDLALYEYAQTLFQERLLSHVPRLEQHTEAFRQRCRALQAEHSNQRSLAEGPASSKPSLEER